jgi:hypothetical protein
MAVDDTYMRRPDETAPTLFQLLPDSAHVPPAYTLAGVTANHDPDTDADPWRDDAPDPSHAVTALYTPDGNCEYQQRVLACRLCLLDDDHGFADDIAGYHEAKVADSFGEDERAAYTDWVDTSMTQDSINGFDRTVFTVREPILSYQHDAQRHASRPVLVMAFAVQSTPWGCLETGAYLCPDPEPGVGRDTVTSVTETLTNRAQRLPRPTVAEDWPLLYGHDQSPEALAAEVNAIIADLADEPNEMKSQRGAVLTYLVDRVDEECDLTKPELFHLLEILEQQGDIEDSSGGLIKPQ